jgi:hypothetical protein
MKMLNSLISLRILAFLWLVKSLPGMKRMEMVVNYTKTYSFYEISLKIISIRKVCKFHHIKAKCQVLYQTKDHKNFKFKIAIIIAMIITPKLSTLKEIYLWTIKAHSKTNFKNKSQGLSLRNNNRRMNKNINLMIYKKKNLSNHSVSQDQLRITILRNNSNSSSINSNNWNSKITKSKRNNWKTCLKSKGNKLNSLMKYMRK